MERTVHTATILEPRPTGRQWRDTAGIAEHIHISERQVRKLMSRHILPYVKIGRLVRFDVDACDEALMRFQIQSITAP